MASCRQGCHSIAAAWSEATRAYPQSCYFRKGWHPGLVVPKAQCHQKELFGRPFAIWCAGYNYAINVASILSRDKDPTLFAQVTLLEARNLPVWGFPWQSNPYCRLTLGSQAVRSRRDDDTSHAGSHRAPVWNQVATPYL